VSTRGVSDGKSTYGRERNQALVRGARLLRIREVRAAHASGSNSARRHAGEIRQDTGADRGSRRDEGRAEEHLGAQVLPRIRARGNGHDRRRLASGEEYAQG